LIPLAIPNLAGNEAAYLNECIETNFVSSVGPFVDRFEADLVRISGADHAVATSSGTTGLHVALIACGVGRDDLVLLPSLTFIASANAIAHCGAMPWLLDIDPDSWTLSAETIERALDTGTEQVDGRTIHRATGRRVAAIMPVHTLGTVADMDPIVAVARSRDLPVVSDGAASLGALYRDRPVGAAGGDLTVFSFNGNKTFTAGGGGAVVGDDGELCALVKHLTTTARIGAAYEHDRIGFNYRLTNLQAAVGCAQLEQLETFLAAKRRIAGRYDRELGSAPNVGVFPDPEWGRSARWLSGIVVHGPSVAAMVRDLNEEGIGARPFWRPIHLQPPYRDAPREPMPHCDAIWTEILTLPCSTQLTDAEQDRVIDAVRRRLG
jgi:dTDP-4-amino-4,6-dideoxygalactose transaminase